MCRWPAWPPCNAIGSGRYDAVAVELDAQRLQALSDPDALARLDLVQVIRKGRVALFAANLALAAYQRRLAKQLDIDPGAELKEAVNLARAQGLPVHLIDREVGLTFKRASGRLGFFGKMKLAGGLLGGLFAADEVGEEEIESSSKATCWKRASAISPAKVRSSTRR